MLVETINGTSNICGLQNFCDPHKISALNFDEIELKFILKNNTPYICDIIKIQNEIMQLTKTKLKYIPQKPKEEIEDIDDYRLEPPKSSEPPESNPIQDNYNAILYENVETQKQQVEKMQILESIQCLKDELIKIKIPVEDVPVVNNTSSYTDIKSVYNILRYKKNINVNSDIAKEVILIGIKQLTYIFNGKKTSWGRMPDLTDWDKTAKSKLNSLKVELSSIVAGFFDHYGIGNLGQIILSLVPSAIIHMAERSDQRPDIDIKADQSLQNLYNM